MGVAEFITIQTTTDTNANRASAITGPRWAKPARPPDPNPPMHGESGNFYPSFRKNRIPGQAAAATDTTFLGRRAVRIATVTFHCVSPLQRNSVLRQFEPFAVRPESRRSSRPNPLASETGAIIKAAPLHYSSTFCPVLHERYTASTISSA
jgi:hypothetical protein